MALPVNHPFHEQEVTAFLTSVSSTSICTLHAPFQGRVIKVGAQLAQGSTTADATLTTNINGTAITGGVITVTQSGSAAGSTFTATPTAANTVNEDDAIGVVVTGSGTGGGPVTVFAKVRRGTI